jgi:hypothetical protein
MLIWPRVVCGSTVVPLSSPWLCLPKPSGHGWLVARGSSWFLCLTWSGDALCQLEVWKGQSFASSRWFCLQSVSPVSLQDFTIGGMLSASSLQPPSWNLQLVFILHGTHLLLYTSVNWCLCWFSATRQCNHLPSLSLIFLLLKSREFDEISGSQTLVGILIQDISSNRVELRGKIAQWLGACQFVALLLTCCVILGKLFNFSESPSPHIWYGNCGS